MSSNGRDRLPCRYKCLRCGHEYAGTYVKGLLEELECPSCASNSQRRLKEKKKPAAKE